MDLFEGQTLNHFSDTQSYLSDKLKHLLGGRQTGGGDKLVDLLGGQTVEPFWGTN